MKKKKKLLRMGDQYVRYSKKVPIEIKVRGTLIGDFYIEDIYDKDKTINGKLVIVSYNNLKRFNDFLIKQIALQVKKQSGVEIDLNKYFGGSGLAIPHSWFSMTLGILPQTWYAKRGYVRSLRERSETRRLIKEKIKRERK